jgi:glycerol-3-phosphate O-acyltransferase
MPLARRLLYAWVRTSVFPEDPQELRLDPAKPVCYVLQDRHLSNLLVLIEESRRAGLPPAELPLRSARSACRDRSFSSTVTAPGRRGASTALLALAGRPDAARRWPTRRSMCSWCRWSFSGGAARTSRIRYSRRCSRKPGARPAPGGKCWPSCCTAAVLVRYNPPISLRDLLQGGLAEEQALRKLSRVLRVHFRRQRQMAIGPDLSHRNTQVHAVLAGERVRAAIASEAQATASARRSAGPGRRFALEIASDYSYGVVRALELFLPGYGRAFTTASNCTLRRRHAHRRRPRDRLRSLPSQPHRLPAAVLRHSPPGADAAPYRCRRQPRPAAGRPAAAPWRRLFLRRSFKGEPLYAAVFQEYLHLMLARGFPVEYFIEGGRSRSGRMLTPKAGILGMTVQSFIREHARPLLFVPVYIGYEKVIEGRTYLGNWPATEAGGIAPRPPEECARHQAGVWQGAREFRRTAGAGRLSRCAACRTGARRTAAQSPWSRRHPRRGSRTRQADQRGGGPQSGQSDGAGAAGDGQAYLPTNTRCGA